MEKEQEAVIREDRAGKEAQGPGPGRELGGGQKTNRTVLDGLPEGTEASVSLEKDKSRKERKKLPEGVSEKAMYKDVLHIAWPALVELTLASLVSMVDMMMVGGLGTWAISAVGLATQPRFMAMMLIMAMNTGVTAVIARARGVNDQEKANHILKQALMLTLIISLLMTVGGLFAARPLVVFMSNGGMEEYTIAQGTLYFQIQMVGYIFMAIISTATATLRGTGNSRSAMYYNIVANIVNVCFNWLLIGGNLGFPALGVAGASIATVIGQVVGCGMALTTLIRGRFYLKLGRMGGGWRGFLPDKGILTSIAKVGLPAMGEQVIMRIGMILFARTVATLGEVQMATHQICLNIQSISFMTGQAFATSATSLVGQSLGKRRTDMAEHYSRRCRRLGLVVAVIMLIVFAAWGGQIVGLYNTDPDVLRLGTMIMLFVAAAQPIQSSQFILSGALRGAGDTRTTAMITLVTVLLLRPTLAWLLVSYANMGVMGAWVAMEADQVTRSALVLWRYNTGKWKTIKV